MNDVVLIDTAEQLRKLEDETAKPYFAQHKSPNLGVGKNIDMVSTLLKAVPEVPNGASNTAVYWGCLRCYHEDAKRGYHLPRGIGIRDGPGSYLITLLC